jgi:hypothetical protein
MTHYEYKVIPAPTRGQKGKGIRGAEARFANALSGVMNQLGAEGWEYIRTDTLPAEERSGLTSRITVYHNMLVFRRAVQADAPKMEVLQPLAAPHAVPALSAPDPVWERLGMEQSDGFDDADSSVIDLLNTRKTRPETAPESTRDRNTLQ